MAETGLHTEEFLSKWFDRPGNREKVVLATKIADRGRRDRIRNGATSLTKANIIDARDGLLQRQQTHRIDLYLIRWLDRNQRSRQVPLLAYSRLGAGMLTGKCLDGATPVGLRLQNLAAIVGAAYRR